MPPTQDKPRDIGRAFDDLYAKLVGGPGAEETVEGYYDDVQDEDELGDTVGDYDEYDDGEVNDDIEDDYEDGEQSLKGSDSEEGEDDREFEQKERKQTETLRPSISIVEVKMEDELDRGGLDTHSGSQLESQSPSQEPYDRVPARLESQDLANDGAEHSDSERERLFARMASNIKRDDDHDDAGQQSQKDPRTPSEHAVALFESSEEGSLYTPDYNDDQDNVLPETQTVHDHDPLRNSLDDFQLHMTGHTTKSAFSEARIMLYANPARPYEHSASSWSGQGPVNELWERAIARIEGRHARGNRSIDRYRDTALKQPQALLFLRRNMPDSSC